MARVAEAALAEDRARKRAKRVEAGMRRAASKVGMPMGRPDPSEKARRAGLGLLAAFPDETLVGLLGQLDPREVARLGTCSKSLRAYCDFSELWKGFVLENLNGKTWRYAGSWKETYLASCGLASGGQGDAGEGGVGGDGRGRREGRPSRRGAERSSFPPGFHSELLYRAWLCARMDPDPAWLEAETVERRPGISREEFVRDFEEPNIPVVVPAAAAEWPAMRLWDRDYLSQSLRGRPVLVGDAPMAFDDYLSYADQQQDELPLYLFDRNFAQAPTSRAAEGREGGEGGGGEGAESAGGAAAERGASVSGSTAERSGGGESWARKGTLEDDYSPLDFLSEDAFSHLPESKRPDYRWLIVGPARSGSTFHVDPNATCAWNAVTRGKKRWILYPPGCPPPGVTPAAGGADVAAPVSVLEWYSCFYSEKDSVARPPLEATVGPGDAIFVPRGWWHQALNLDDDTIAVTQNYAPPASLPHVLAFLASRDPDLVSGLRSDEARRRLFDDLVDALSTAAPDVLAAAQAVRGGWEDAAKERRALAALFKEEPASDGRNDGGACGGFSFGF